MSTTPELDFAWEDVELEQAIDWNTIEDPLDNDIWKRLVSQFWVPEKIALSNDLPSWGTFTDDEKLATVRALTGLTLLDSIQGKVGAISMIPDARTSHEVAVLTNIAFMEEIHAKSYSSIFSTLISSNEIKDTFRWSRENEFLKKKAAIILHYYRGEDPLKRKIASTLLESFLFYSGFFLPLWWSSKGKLTNTADIIRLIIRDEALHGYYLGAKFQQGFREQTPERQEELREFFEEVSTVLLDNEDKYTEHLYDAIGLTEDVKAFLRLNLNKAADNLGFEQPHPGVEQKVPTQILASLDPGGSETHDFFSGSGAAYLVAGVATDSEESGMSDDDWEW